MREIVRLGVVVAVAAVAAAGAAYILEQRPKAPPSAGDRLAAKRVRAYYAANPPRPDWHVRDVEATQGRVLVHLEVPSAQAAALLKSPMGFQQASIAEACPGADLWDEVGGATDLQIRATMPSGEPFLRVDCRRFTAPAAG